MVKSVSLMIVTVQSSNVRSPETLSSRPLKGTANELVEDCGNCAVLQRNDVSSTSPPAYAGKLSVALNRFAL